MKNINPIEFEAWLQNLTQEVADEAVKIAKDYPELTIREVIEKAKEVITSEVDRGTTTGTLE